MIPLHAGDALSQGVTRLASGAADALAGSAVLADKIEKVRELGERAELRKGLERFHEETMNGFRNRNDYENFARDWDDAVATKLPGYLPDDLSSSMRSDLSEAIRELKTAGGIQVRELAHLGMVDRARSSWKSGVEDAARRGNGRALDKGLEEGSGVFIPVSEVESFKRELLQHGEDAAIERESLANPIISIRELDEKRHPFSGREDKSLDLKAKCAEQALVTREHLGEFYASQLAKGNPLDAQSIYNAEKRMFLTPEQARALLDGEAQKRREMMGGIRFRVSEANLCEWRRRIDERNVSREGEAGFLISLATAGLPQRDFSFLYDRFKKTAEVEPELRKYMSRELNAMYRNGLWGAPGDEVTCKAWRYMQDKVMDAVAQDPSRVSRDKVNELISSERKKLGSAWVDFASMQARKSNTSGAAPSN